MINLMVIYNEEDLLHFQKYFELRNTLMMIYRRTSDITAPKQVFIRVLLKFPCMENILAQDSEFLAFKKIENTMTTKI